MDSVRRVEVPEFDRDAYEQFSLPARIGSAIASLDNPTVVPGVQAAHLRPDDYVIGVALSDESRAYPLWVIDNYHAVNDRLAGTRLLVASCERCQSGAAFVADLPVRSDREPLFRGIGILNAVLLLKDIQTGTWWNHYEGIGLRGRLAGVVLDWVPAFHLEWRAWLRRHPETTVVVPPSDPTHPDARHGHGREEFFSRPGLDPVFVPTISGPLDHSYPENEMVLGVGLPGAQPVAFPLAEVQREGGVVHDRTGEGEVVVFAGPEADGFTMAAYRPESDGRPLAFRREEGAFVDSATGTRWTIEGLGTEGPLAGARLEPVRWSYVRWHAWIYFHRDTRRFTSATTQRPFDTDGGDDPTVGAFLPVLRALSDGGHRVQLCGPLVSQRRPREADVSLVLTVDEDRVVLHRFRSRTAAEDYAALEGGWSGYPMRARMLGGELRRIGEIVLESDPVERFADPTQIVALPRRAVRWAAALGSRALEILEAGAATATGPEEDASSEPPGPPGFRQVLKALRLAGFEVIDVGFLPPGQLRVGCENGIALTVGGDRFLLYRFGSTEQAAGYAAEEPHAVVAGRFVARSTPETMYVEPRYEILYAGDAAVRWSPLLGEARFIAALGAADPAALEAEPGR